MPSIETMHRHQLAVLWEAVPGRNNIYGEQQLEEPVEIYVRWEEGQQEALDPNGTSIAIDATVFFDENLVVPVMSILFLGTVADYQAVVDANQEPELKQLKLYKFIPDLKNRHTRREGLLMKWSGTLPELAGTGT